MNSNENTYSSDSSSGESKSYESQTSQEYNSETVNKIDIIEDTKKYNAAKPKRIIIKARLIND